MRRAATPRAGRQVSHKEWGFQGFEPRNRVFEIRRRGGARAGSGTRAVAPERRARAWGSRTGAALASRDGRGVSRVTASWSGAPRREFAPHASTPLRRPGVPGRHLHASPQVAPPAIRRSRQPGATVGPRARRRDTSRPAGSGRTITGAEGRGRGAGELKGAAPDSIRSPFTGSDAITASKRRALARARPPTAALGAPRAS